jgi:acyl-CoA oxidase
MPATSEPGSLLARREAAMFEECSSIARKHGHRSPQFTSRVMEQCAPMVEAIGCRMAYDAAVAEGVPRPLIDIYVCAAVKADPRWSLAPGGGANRESLAEMQDRALAAAEGHMSRWVEDMGAGPYVRSPIVDDETWASFVESLEKLRPMEDSELDACTISAQTGLDRSTMHSDTWHTSSLKQGTAKL